MLQPELTSSSRSASVPPRPVTSRPRLAPSSTPTPTSKLPDFTEDPFRDYRYEDPFDIADPFADEPSVDDTRNANNAGKQLDPFGLETSHRGGDDNDTFARGGFESDFSKTFPILKKSGKDRKLESVTGDVANAFGDANSNLKFNELDFPDTFASKTTRPVNYDAAFSMNNDKTGKKSGLERTPGFKEKLYFGERKSKSAGNGAWKNGNSNIAPVGSLTMIEEQQLAWASQQSLKAEEERRRIKEQEEAELAMALELSKHEKTGKF